MSIATATFVLLVGGAAWFDVHERRVPNWLYVTLLGTGVLFGLASVSAWTDMVLGIGIAFGVILPFFALRVYRGGDAKLLIACGAWFQPLEWLVGFALGMAFGAVWALLVLGVKRGERREALLSLRLLFWSRLGTVGEDVAEGRTTVPMAVAFGASMTLMKLVNVEAYLA